nr:MAG TPA: SPBC3B9.21 protein, SPAC19A8.12 protein [Caudoviricetes sp.]DAQ99445.1 MAG TPA: SPBC3B9.21 protein, SPAC19A8.12 protein [Caudoviricetes sp.]
MYNYSMKRRIYHVFECHLSSDMTEVVNSFSFVTLIKEYLRFVGINQTALDSICIRFIVNSPSIKHTAS